MRPPPYHVNSDPGNVKLFLGEPRRDIDHDFFLPSWTDIGLSTLLLEPDLTRPTPHIPSGEEHSGGARAFALVKYDERPG